jgi:hypothetical protein
MKIEINSDHSIGQVKDSFHKKLPYLKLEVFYHSHGEGEASPKSDLVPDEVSISTLIEQHAGGSIEFNVENTIYELEKKLKDYFGLNIQIFRQSGKLWLESTTSDHWTLTKVKEEAEEFSH